MCISGFPTIDLKATGANIVKLRQEVGLSVRDLQLFFGFESPQAVYKWQWGESLPTVDNLYALSRLLNKSMEEILVLTPESSFFIQYNILNTYQFIIMLSQL